MNKRKIWKCDFENCTEIADHYRRVQGKPVKICLHHEVDMRKQRMGKPLDFSQLSVHDIRYLEEKDGEFEFECPNCEFKMVIPVEDIIDESDYPCCPRCKIIMNQV